MIKLFYVIVIIATIFIGLTFTHMNSQLVELKYLSFYKEISLALLLICTLAVGVFVGFFASLLSSMKVRRNLSKAKKEIKKLEISSL